MPETADWPTARSRCAGWNIEYSVVQGIDGNWKWLVSDLVGHTKLGTPSAGFFKAHV
jgi:hypothetical protein